MQRRYGAIQAKKAGVSQPSAHVHRRGRDNVAEGAIEQAGSSSGEALPGDVQKKFEESLGTDLSGVRVHSSEPSAQAAEAARARAYTTGNDIHFGSGEYNPASIEGQNLLAHEVAHTVQQRGGGVPSRQNQLDVSQPGDVLEQEADNAARRMVAGQDARVSGGSALARKVLQRAEPHRGAPAGAKLPPTGPLTATGDMPAQDVSAPSALKPLSPADKADLVSQAAGNIRYAGDAFVTACRWVKTELRDAAARDAAIFGVICDVALGFLAPGIAGFMSRGVGKVVGRLHLAESPEWAQKAAAYLSAKDFSEAVVGATATVAKDQVAANADSFAGLSEDEAFLSQMQTTFKAAFGVAALQLNHTTPDATVAAAWAAYHPTVATIANYGTAVRALVSRYHAQVTSIGKSRTMKGNLGGERYSFTDVTKLARITDMQGKLAVITYLDSVGRDRFDNWVDDDFREMALARAGRGVVDRKSWQVEGLPNAHSRPEPKPPKPSPSGSSQSSSNAAGHSTPMPIGHLGAF